MTSELFTADCELRLPRESGPARLRLEKGVFVMNLKGSYEEMGRQHARLVRGIVDDYVPRYFLGFLEKMIAHSIGHNSSLPARIAALLYSLFGRLNHKRVGANLEGQIKGFIEELGLDHGDGNRLILFADILHFLAGKALAPMCPPCCSGFFARGNATKDGQLVIGRNFDFFGRGVWNTNQCITVFHPEDTRPYLWVGALGLPIGGFGVSESGIAIMMFTKFCKDVGFTGAPLFTICHEILEKAESVEDAIEIIGRQKRMASLSIFVTDSRARDAAVVGFSANRMEVIRPENDVLARTNHYLTEELRDVQIASTVWRRHTQGRFMRIHEMLKDKYGTLTPADAAGILSDALDPYERKKRVVGDIIASTNNALSAVLSPDDDALHIAQGPFPVCNSDKYLGFSLSKLFAEEPEAGIADLPGGCSFNEKEKAALAHYEEAWTEHLERFDDGRAIFHLRRAAELLPDEPIFDRVAGILLMRNGRFSDAAAHLEKNAAYDYRDIRMKAESLLWHARSLDLLDRHADALPLYRQAIALEDTEISMAATNNINSPFQKKQLSGVSVEFIVGSPYMKYV